MKTWELRKRVSDISEKLRTVHSEVVTLDFDSFPEPEKQLFRKIWEIQNEYGLSPPTDVLEANMEFVSKAMEVYVWRVMQLFMFVMEASLGNDEVEVWYFKLHFYNFIVDLNECLQRVREWPEEDREEFLRDMKEHDMMNKVFRVPRGCGAEGPRRKRNKQEGQSR